MLSFKKKILSFHSSIFHLKIHELRGTFFEKGKTTHSSEYRTGVHVKRTGTDKGEGGGGRIL